MNGARYLLRREDYQPPQTHPDSPFKSFNVSCLKCGSLRLKFISEFDDDSGETAVFLFCPLLNGLQATCLILKVAPATKVLMLSAHSDEAYIVEAVNSGAKGYLIKQTSTDSICTAIREVHKGNTFFSSSIPKHLHKRLKRSRPSEQIRDSKFL